MANLTEKQMQILINNQSETLKDYTISKQYIYYPFVNKSNSLIDYATALVMHHCTSTEEKKEHTTVLSFRKDETFSVWCGDSFLTGCLSDNKCEDRIEKALLNSNIPKGNRGNIQLLMQRSKDLYPANSGCNNVRLQSNLDRALDNGKNIEEIVTDGSAIVCRHTKNMFAQMPEFKEVSRILRKMHSVAFKKNRNKKTDSKIDDALKDFGFQGEAIFIAGPGGHGKTHTIKSNAEANGFRFVELQGHGQIEAIDMFGYDKKYGDNMVWFDGPISQAARLAHSGVKTLLFIDEFLNIPMRETAGLKASFEPYKGHYHFQTNRIASITDGIAVMEEIKVPVENLQIITAANIGSGYANEEIDKALKQRFMMIHYTAEDTKVRSVLASICKEKSFSLSLVDKLMNFKKKMEQKVEESLVEEAPTMRHLSRKFLGLMKSEDELATIAHTQILQFVEFDVDGKPVSEQVEMVEEIIDMTLE